MDYRETNRQLIPVFRAGEALPGMHRERLLLLTTTGRRSGDSHTTPMMFHREDDRLFVIASNVGAPQDPDWCLNLRRNPRSSSRPATNRAARRMRRPQRCSRAMTARRSGGGSPSCTRSSCEHQQRTDREIPVVELTRS